MCRCYEVGFNFSETFSPDTSYQFHDNYQTGALEWVQLVEEDKDKIVLQHLLIVGDTMIIKHWRQDWLYENTELYQFTKDKTWSYVSLPKNEVKGQWTQKVFQVDDSPRYEGSATWVHVDGKRYWENTTDAPLPRREFSKRSDYNVMKRTNRHEITSFGWLHEQDNDKVLRSEAEEQVIAHEKGWNPYRKVDDGRCQLAQEWWQENQAYWAKVRTEWDALFDRKQTLALQYGRQAPFHAPLQPRHQRFCRADPGSDDAVCEGVEGEGAPDWRGYLEKPRQSAFLVGWLNSFLIEVL